MVIIKNNISPFRTWSQATTLELTEVLLSFYHDHIYFIWPWVMHQWNLLPSSGEQNNSTNHRELEQLTFRCFFSVILSVFNLNPNHYRSGLKAKTKTRGLTEGTILVLVLCLYFVTVLTRYWLVGKEKQREKDRKHLQVIKGLWRSVQCLKWHLL